MEATHVASSRTRLSHSAGAGLGALSFGLSAGPLAWYIQLVINYALASHTCFPDGSPLDRPPAGWLGIDIDSVCRQHRCDCPGAGCEPGIAADLGDRAP